MNSKKTKKPLRRAKHWGARVWPMAGRLAVILAAVTVMGLMFSALQAVGSMALRAVISLAILSGVLLMLYNLLRFGSVAEFGQSYQLAGVDVTKRAGNQLAYVPPGLWYYLLARPHLTLGFPFVHLVPPPLSYPFTPPHDYDGVEPVGGLLVIAPFALLALTAPFALRGTARRVALGLVAVGLLIVLMTSYALWGATMRYEIDFATPLLLAAAVAWLATVVRLTGRRRRLATGAGAVLVAWTALCGIAISFTGYYSSLRSWSPDTWHRLQAITSPLPTAIAKLDGKPQLADMWIPSGFETDSDPGAGLGRLTFRVSATTTAQLDVVSGSARIYGLQVTAAPAKPEKPPGPGARLDVATPDVHRVLHLPPTLASTTLPVHLRRGMNRIKITLVGARKDEETRLSDVQLVPAPPQEGG